MEIDFGMFSFIIFYLFFYKLAFHSHSDCIAPLIPKDFVFGSQTIRSVVMILLHNSVVCSHKHHSQIRKLVTWPQRSNLIKIVAKISS
jgi:hypothetical protein